jgi:hypothetical protein
VQHQVECRLLTAGEPVSLPDRHNSDMSSAAVGYRIGRLNLPNVRGYHGLLPVSRQRLVADERRMPAPPLESFETGLIYS